LHDLLEAGSLGRLFYSLPMERLLVLMCVVADLALEKQIFSDLKI
jgi:hypothetical protein